MASTQEQRIQLKRIATAAAGAADKWSTREQLCLASAVAYSGDQNWMSVSRSLKLLCGTNRPADWFSQKSCAVQYGELLENVETPKRKKRISGDIGGAGSSSSGGAPNTETPTESILRKLTQERISELRALIQREQEEFVKLREEILYVQSSLPTETELREMLAQIEMEKEQKLLEQQKYVQWIKEREELQKCSWRPGTSQQAQQQQPIPSTSAAAQLQQQQQNQQGKPNLQLNLNIKSEDMETEDSNSNTKAGTGTSPLLTSLLKSPSPAPAAATSSSSSSTSITQISSNLRATAPTITNLLTGGNTQIQQQITTAPSTSTLSSPYNNSVHNQPLTGPIPVHPQFQQTIPTTPSKSAPTLSMLLENKNKENLSATATSATTSSATTVIIDSSSSSTNSIITKDETMNAQQQEAMEEGQDGDDNKDEDQQLMEVFKGLLPDNIEELADILTNNNAIILNPELLEEESILENVESLIDDEQEVDDEVIAENKEDLKNDVIVNNQQKPEKSTETNVEKKISLTTTIENKQNPKDARDMENISDFSKEPKTENDLKVDKNKNDGIDDHGNLDISKIKEEIKMEIDQEEEIIKSLDTNEENMEKEVSIKGVKGINDKAINDFKEAQIKTKDEKTQNSETSDDSSDNTTLQMLKEKISTVTESSITSISITKNEESSLSSVSELQQQQQQNNTTVTVAADKKPETINLSAAENDEINKKEVLSPSTENIEKSINQNEDDLSSKSSKDATTIEMIEEKYMEEKTNKESFIIKQEKEDISKVGNEIIETNTENCSSSVEDEQKKYSSESSVIVIQEDDDESNNATERNVSVTALSNEQRSATNLNQNENENLQKMNTMKKISVVDLQRIDDELLGVQDEKQILKSMDDERRTFKKNVEQNSKIVIDHTTKKDQKDQNECKITDKVDKVVINDRKSNSVAAVATIVIDTDEELSMEVVKDDQIPRMKRDYSRKKLDTSVGNMNSSATTAAAANSITIGSASPGATTTTNATTVTASTSTTATVAEKKFEERTTTTSDDNTSTIVSSSSSNRQNLSIKRLKEREGSESPLVVVNDDETTTDSIPRTRRRYSSTPIFDSIPNSPASSDDKEYKAWKKSILMIYNRLTIHKNASIFLRPVTEDLAPNYKQIVHKPMDLQTIKRNIETGVIRTTTEFQRDVMLMCQNAIMYNQTNNNVYNMAKEMWADSVNVIETLLESVKKDATTTAEHHRTSSAASSSSSNVNTGTTTANTVKSRGRKSNRLP